MAVFGNSDANSHNPDRARVVYEQLICRQGIEKGMSYEDFKKLWPFIPTGYTMDPQGNIKPFQMPVSEIQNTSDQGMLGSPPGPSFRPY